MRRLVGIDGVTSAVGEEIGVSPWLTVTQADIDAFAEATGDRYWLHVDPERAAGTTFGSTIAHGLLTLSLGPRFSYGLYEIDGVSVTLNYGYARVRFPAPLPVDSRVRMRARLVAAEAAPNGVTATMELTFEREGGERPVCVAEQLLRVVA